MVFWPSKRVRVSTKILIARAPEVAPLAQSSVGHGTFSRGWSHLSQPISGPLAFHKPCAAHRSGRSTKKTHSLRIQNRRESLCLVAAGSQPPTPQPFIFFHLSSTRLKNTVYGEKGRGSMIRLGIHE